MDVSLRRAESEDINKVWLMYLSFEPKGAFQGLPPTTPEAVKDWLRKLARDKATQFVIEVGERVVGHTMLCPGPQADHAELGIFLHQDYRGRGLGKQLLLCTLHYGCKQLKLSRVWLTVHRSNAAALACFRSAGFAPSHSTDGLLWEVDLQRHSNCEQCKGDECPAFLESLPRTIAIQRAPHRKP